MTKALFLSALLAACVPLERNKEEGGAASSASASDDPPLGAGFKDDFNREQLGADWRSLDPAWRLRDGKLCVEGAHNRPLWLTRRLPSNARITFTATSASADGDLKVELWGDGRSGAKGREYRDATGYLAILGGWKNRFHVLARQDEHAPDRLEQALSPEGAPSARPVEKGRTYRFLLVREDGKTLRWFVDDVPLLSYVDARPLEGPGHDHFGFNDWEAPVCFDDLVVEPLENDGAGGD